MLSATTEIDTVNSFNHCLQSTFSEVEYLDSVPFYNLPGQCPILVSATGDRKLVLGLKKGESSWLWWTKKEVDIRFRSFLSCSHSFLSVGSIPSVGNWLL